MSSGANKLSRRQLLAGFAGTGLLAGCASNNTPSVLYGLTAADLETEPGRNRGAQVLVPRPRALKALDTDNIAVVDSGPVYSYFPKAAWADTLPSVIQTKMVQTLENTGRLRGVGFPGDGLLIDYQLQIEVRAFELRLDGANRGVVELAARLVNDRNGRAVASRVFRAETPSGGTSVDQAVAAMNRSADQVFADMAAWVLGRV
ncbi:cholesterol transport system auxiliary component [Roseibium hamelinense]|uniref:Cholesterol transport system auxiliary component n=1 Tax=Roseibium hamelinense TaxID=150831 RepID=A0A562T9T3_9HYPH|nr:ABC-type transport auxiliary lipoprotein family protein [Roseibium hamelinense]MTI45292.1 ABC transporter [Roseibium hamelinense]TWI90342.1 cholesterol transport system auxiliary component [Roseibium hamelinense]